MKYKTIEEIELDDNLTAEDKEVLKNKLKAFNDSNFNDDLTFKDVK